MTYFVRRRQRGFTIIEAIAVIVITGIVGAIVSVFIQIPIRTYLTTVSRAEATDLADNTMRRLTRDLRLALPNSVRVNTGKNYIEYIETKAGLRYLAEDDVDSGGGAFLSWNDPAETTFVVVGGVPGGRHAPVKGDSVVVYNLGPDQQPGDAYACVIPGYTNCNRAAISDLTTTTITLSANPFYQQTLAGTPLMSPSKRFHVVSGAVSYGCDGATRRLMRYWGYGIPALQATPPTTGSSAILAENVESCTFSYQSLANQRSGLIGITLRFLPQDGSTTPITLVHQIHVNSTP